MSPLYTHICITRKNQLMDTNEIIERILLAFKALELDKAIDECERKMLEKDGFGQCNQDSPEAQGS